MFNPNATLIEAFVNHALTEFCELFPAAEQSQLRTIEQACITAFNTLLNCDCPYHDLNHTMLVTDAGFAILKGRQTARGDLSAHDWIQAVVAMLFHDIGFVRQLLTADTPHTSVINPNGESIQPPDGATDAVLSPHHVTRSVMYAAERFANDEHINTDLVTQCIEMTRFPVPTDAAYQATDTLPGLVRAADLIGQMADPQYLQKLTRLFAEFVEIGEAQRLGFENAAELRASFPEFFYSQVHPYIGDGIAYLKLTQDGWYWIANLYHHLNTDRGIDPKEKAPELVVDNSLLDRIREQRV